jgi:hypothetical protein
MSAVGSMRSLTVVDTGVWILAGLALLVNVEIQQQWILFMVMFAMFVSTGVAAVFEHRTGISVRRDFRENASLSVRRLSRTLLVGVSLVYIVLTATWVGHIFL